MIASEKGYLDIARLVVAYGANPTITNLMESALDLATWHGHLEIVKLLYETGRFDSNVETLLFVLASFLISL